MSAGGQTQGGTGLTCALGRVHLTQTCRHQTWTPSSKMALRWIANVRCVGLAQCRRSCITPSRASHICSYRDASRAAATADVYKYCSPTRSGIQSGRHPFHVNPINAAPDIYNPGDPVSGFAAIPRNMTGIGTKMSAAGYKVSSIWLQCRHAK